MSADPEDYALDIEDYSADPSGTGALSYYVGPEAGRVYGAQNLPVDNFPTDSRGIETPDENGVPSARNDGTPAMFGTENFATNGIDYAEKYGYQDMFGHENVTSNAYPVSTFGEYMRSRAENGEIQEMSDFENAAVYWNANDNLTHPGQGVVGNLEAQDFLDIKNHGNDGSGINALGIFRDLSLAAQEFDIEGGLDHDNFMNGLGSNIDQGGPAAENHGTQRMVGARHGEEPESLKAPQ